MDLEDDFQAELARLAAINEELLGVRQAETLNESGEAPWPGLDEAEEITLLRTEVQALRNRVAELENTATVEDWQERQLQYEIALEEKDQIIQTLKDKVATLTESKGLNSGELEHAFRELEEDRRRFKEDEESLEKQGREMEMALAKERADIARQRADVQRMQTDLNREIEQANRDPLLRERLQSLQRRPSSRVDLPRPVTTPAANTSTEPVKKTGSGIFRRLFGGAPA